MIIFRWFFDDFSSKEKIKHNLGNHQKIIVLLEKPWKSKILASFLVLIKQNDDFSIIFWWFFDDFWRFCFKRENQTKPRKSSKNHRFAWKNMKIKDFGKFSCFNQTKRWELAKILDFHCFSSKTIIFWWLFDDFLGFVWFVLVKQNLQK